MRRRRRRCKEKYNDEMFAVSLRTPKWYGPGVRL
jgi:hypothetical protein